MAVAVGSEEAEVAVALTPVVGTVVGVDAADSSGKGETGSKGRLQPMTVKVKIKGRIITNTLN